ncbi:MAG: hypothetical protein KDA39_04570 [Hyphomonas sp.]|nr:hypothetical protein [Hyphomonas sp.]
MTRRFWRPLMAALSRLSRRSPNSDTDSQRDRRRAARALETKLPPHLRRDIGADDG